MSRFNPQVASESTLTPGEIGIEEFARFVLQVGALQSIELPTEFRAVGQSAIVAEPPVARVTAATSTGSYELDMVRGDGRWLVAALPDLALPPQAPYAIRWDVSHSYVSASSGRLVVVGTIDNVSDVTLLELSVAGYIADELGRSLATGTSPVIVRPFVGPGESTNFRIDIRPPEGVQLDPAQFVLIPNYRVAFVSDEASDEEALTPVTVVPQSISLEVAAQGRALTITNQDERESMAVAVAFVRDASGRVLAIYRSPSAVIPGGGSRRVEMPPADSAALAGAAEVTIEAWGAIRPAGS